MGEPSEIAGTAQTASPRPDSFARRVRLPILDFGFPLPARRKLTGKRGTRVQTIESPKWNVPAQIRYRYGSEETRRYDVPKRIPQLVAEYFGFALMPFHKDILKLMFEGGYLDIQIPTEHGKSTLCNVVYSVLMLMHDPDAAIILCGTNLDDAKSWLARIKDKLDPDSDSRSAALIRDYPWLERPIGGTKRWGSTEITIAGRSDVNNRNPSVFAIGRGADGIRQRRGRFVGDDLEGKGAVRDSARVELWNWMTKEAMRTIEDVNDVPRRMFCNVGTPFDPDSVHIKLEEMKYANGKSIFQVYKQPYKYESGRLIWPRKRQKIEELRALWADEPETWAIAMELNPKSHSPFSLTVREVQEKTGGATSMPITDWTFVSLDPASGSRKSRADYAGIVVERIRWEEDWILPRVEVVECYRYSEEAIAQVTFALELAEKHKAPIVVEVNAMQRVYKGLFTHFARQLRQGGTISWFDERRDILTHYTTKANKTDNKMGVTVVKTLARSGNLRILESDGSKVLQREIANLGTGSDDHITMAAWFAIRYVYDHRRRKQRPTLDAPSRLPFPYQPLVGRGRMLRLHRVFQDRRYLEGSQPGEERYDRPMLRDDREG